MNKETAILGLANIINAVIPKRKNGIIFYSNPDYTDSCLSLSEFLCASHNRKRFDITWVVRDPKRFKEVEGIRFVKHRSLKSLFYMCRSRYIFRTHSFWGNKYRTNRQIMCVTWHGMPIKSMTGDDLAKIKKTNCNYLLSTSVFFNKELSQSMGIDISKCVITGLPRNDDLFKDNGVTKYWHLDEYNAVILWMPTFRQNKDADYCDGVEAEFGIPLCSKRELDCLNELCQEKNYLLILKLHPWAANKLSDLKYSNILNLKNEDIPVGMSLYNLIGQADALITDYSSVYIDYLLLKRPIGFVIDDIQEYRNSRGFIIEPVEKYMPGMKISSFDELKKWLNAIDKGDGFEAERERMSDLFHVYKDNKSTERVLDLIGLN